ncbi:ribonuclease H-like domain-containing protein [Tanacetum coccineum]
MQDEYNTLIANGTWVLVPRPQNVNAVRFMWLFKHKFRADGSLSRYKARLVANGCSQQQGIDCDETFSSVVKSATICTVLSLAVSHAWLIHQLDVKNAFLHGHLSETIYMHQPPGFVDPTRQGYVCLLKKSLYGLKQAPRAWFQRFASHAIRVGFRHSSIDSSLSIYHQGIEIGYLLLHVDDIILTASSSTLLHRLISILHTHMLNCNPCKTLVDTDSKLGPDDDPVEDPTLFRSLAGALQYLTFTRPDLSYAVQQASCPSTRRSTSGYCVFLSDNLIMWSSKRQHVISRSSAEAKYRGVANVVAKTAWVRNLLQELLVPLRSPH